MPALMAPSPITATTLCVLPPRSRATAMPSPAEIEVEEGPAPNASYSLSARLRRAGPAPPPEASAHGPEGRASPPASGYDQATAWDSRRSCALPGGILGKEAMDQRVMHLYRP